jgi:small subunit ribosomal protein S17
MPSAKAPARSTATKVPAKSGTRPPSEPVTGTQTGVVESDKRDKTRTVVVRWSVKHAKYGKYMKKRTVLHVHDEGNESHTGDTVEVAPCRPLSKTKFYTLVRVVQKSAGVGLLHE